MPFGSQDGQPGRGPLRCGPVSYTHLDVYKRQGQTCFLTFINGAFALLIPAALLIASGGDVRTALVNLIFYALFAPACGQMINRIMYMLSLIHI